MIKRIIIIISLPLLTGCFDSELEFEDQYKTVVEAYLYVDREINNCYLSSMISFGSEATGGEKITDAHVVLERADESWTLLHIDSLPGTYYLDESPVMEPGDTFRLEVVLDEETLIAETLIPGSPPEVSLSSSSIYIPKVESMMDFRNMTMPDPVELTWNNPDANYYFLNIQNIENYPVSIMPDPPDDRPFAGGGFAFQMITQPTNDNYYIIPPQQLTHFGTHRIIMTSVNEEYVNLYNSLNQDTRELNEPYSNIEGGLGIFTAFNSDTLYLEVCPVYD